MPPPRRREAAPGSTPQGDNAGPQAAGTALRGQEAACPRRVTAAQCRWHLQRVSSWQQDGAIPLGYLPACVSSTGTAPTLLEDTGGWPRRTIASCM